MARAGTLRFRLHPLQQSKELRQETSSFCVVQSCGVIFFICRYIFLFVAITVFRMSTSRSISRNAKRRLLDSLTNTADSEESCHVVTEIFGADRESISLSEVDNFDDSDILPVSGVHGMSDSDSECLSSPFENETSSSSDDMEMSLTEDLLLFYKLFNISRAAMQFLLDVLKRKKLDVPQSVYLLDKMSKKKQHIITEENDCKMSYFGLEDTLKFCLSEKSDYLSSNAIEEGDRVDITVRINYDGIPLYKSSPCSVWALSIIFTGLFSKPLPLGISYGPHKPDVSIFLKPLAEDLNVFTTQGKVVCGINVFVRTIFFNLDAPAKSDVCGILGHTAKRGCGYCRSEGTYDCNRVIFSTCVGESRTDSAYRDMRESNQLSMSPFLSVQGFGIRSSCPPDYQHLVCLGLVRKLFYYYFMQTKNLRLRCKVKAADIKHLSDRIEGIAVFWPTEFQRKPRRIDICLPFFKATEYRFFLLYLFFTFKDCLPTEYYEHYLLFHCAVRILLSDRHRHFSDTAKAFIEKFVSSMPSLFGRQSVTYNVHCLLHVHEYYMTIGNLDRFSTFPFENFLSKLKHRVRKTRHIFAQTLNQLEMIKIFCSHTNDESLNYSDRSPNNCCLTESGVWILCDKLDGIVGSGYKLAFSCSLYDTPMPSSELGIGRYVKSKQYVSERLTNKAVCFPMERDYIIIPFV